MNIEKLSLNLRPRNRWEAVDLGFAMARQWFWPLWVLWVLVALPVALVLGYLTLHVLEWGAGWCLFLFWWLKPLYEQPLLYYLSRVLFGEELSINKHVFQRYWQVVKPQLLPLLTYRRFSFSRSFDNPVAMLEQLHGKMRGKRLTLLHRQQGSVAMWLTVLYVHVEVILQLSVIMLLALLMPPEQQMLEWSDLFLGDMGWMEWLNLLTYLWAASVVAPFYVAAGFVMYINRRAELEGWDIELQFKRLRQRIAQRDSKRQPTGKHPSNKPATNGGRVLGLALAAALGMAMWATPQPATAQTVGTEANAPLNAPSTNTLDKTSAKEQIDAILASDAFGEHKTYTKWKEKPTKALEEQANTLLGRLLVYIVALIRSLLGEDSSDTSTKDESDTSDAIDMNILASLLEGALWLLAVALLTYLLYHFGKWANAMGWLKLPSGVPEKELPPTELFGLKLNADSLPDDVPAQALKLLEQGEWRACLALLYRASLVRLIHQHGLGIKSSFTEQECDRLVQTHRPAMQAGYFSRLTQLWLLLAYGHQQPDAQEVRQLCKEWSACFPEQTALGMDNTGQDGGLMGAGA